MTYATSDMVKQRMRIATADTTRDTEIRAIYDSGRKGHSNGVEALMKGIPLWS